MARWGQRLSMAFAGREIAAHAYSRRSVERSSFAEWSRRQPGDDLLEPGQRAQRVEIRVVLDPGAEALAGAHGAVEQVEGRVELAGHRMAARRVVEDRVVGGPQGHGLIEPRAAPFPLADADEEGARHVERPDVVGTVLQGPVGGFQ